MDIRKNSGSRTMCWRLIVGVVLVVLVFVSLCTSSMLLEAIDDTILHKINWAGPFPEESLIEPLETPDSLIMRTARNEKYKCILPKAQDGQIEDAAPYAGPNPLELLSPLFTQSFACTFKLEQYWMYELCHGRYIRQYHEERDGKKVKRQEYFLGRWTNEEYERMRTNLDREMSNPDFKSQIPTKKIDGVNMPYLQINMTDGTFCDLNTQPRMTRVLYVCYPLGKHEIYSLEETSTCEYEIVVLSPNLCEHPDYKSKDAGENLINCHSLSGAPKMPRALVELEAESFKLKHEHLLQNLESLLETKIKGDVRPIEILTEETEEEYLKPSKPSLHDNSFLAGFLSGKNCLTGGSNWWKFEYCYGKYVLQYHLEDKSGSRTEITLGRWNKDKHIEYLEKHPHKKSITMQNKRTVIQYYSNGDSCDQTGQPRSVEVKLKCVDNPSPSAIAVYLLEPKTCEYTLGVESSLLCPLLKQSDDYGLFDVSEFVAAAEKAGSKSASPAPVSGASKPAPVPKNSLPPGTKARKVKGVPGMEIVVLEDENVENEEDE
ncbi:unnamed protein product [Orchesella dallaii]|uniref:Endoplasmic reticulum lectin 1 n=1 Tax=Orchesella dallaii TaxID=48710 RepID=A0ABP1QWI0_9HEXA